MITTAVKDILDNYGCENSGVKGNLYRILMSGSLAGTGKMIILPVDQGFEHGPIRSFAKNPSANDPDYHFKLAINTGFNAYAAPLGFLEASADKFAGQIPMILKLNSSNSLLPKSAIADQSLTASVSDALRIGCIAIGLTIYPGSEKSLEMIEEAKEVIREAKSCGLVAIVWCYPRGGDLTKEAETSIDVCSYAAHMAALLGANIIKVKLPTCSIFQPEAKKLFESENIQFGSLSQRIALVVKSCFNGKRLVVFSGGEAKTDHEILAEAREIRAGGGSGSIIGRNSFQRLEGEASGLISSICNIYSQPIH